eukprot:4663249-Alexandrium_andersonii.AAC.1
MGSTMVMDNSVRSSPTEVGDERTELSMTVIGENVEPLAHLTAEWRTPFCQFGRPEPHRAR